MEIKQAEEITRRMIELVAKAKVPMFRNKEEVLVKSYQEFYRGSEDLMYNMFGFSTYLAGVIDAMDPRSILNKEWRSAVTNH